MKYFLPIIIFVFSLANYSFAAEIPTKWVNADNLPLIGKAVDSPFSRYSRLPDSLQNISRPSLWDLGRNSAGLAIRFRSNSSIIKAEWDVWLNRAMNHMTPTGIRGLDLYALQPDGTWTFVNSGRPGTEAHNISTITADMTHEMREYILYLPLYDECTSLRIGIDSLSTIEPPKIESPITEKPIVWYGSSILQGGCASRPGMAVTNIIERRINSKIINFGFSGNAQLDYEIAHVIAATDPSIIILDFVPNITLNQLNERMINFYKIIRAKHPSIPIIFIEDPLFPHMRFNSSVYKNVIEKNEDLKTNFDSLKNSGEKNIYLISSENMIGKDSESTVDGTHFTDLGFMRYADYMTPIITKLLSTK